MVVALRNGSRRSASPHPSSLEDEITDLFEMFPLLDSALIQDIYLCSDRDWDTTVDTLLVMAGSTIAFGERLSCRG